MPQDHGLQEVCVRVGLCVYFFACTFLLKGSDQSLLSVMVDVVTDEMNDTEEAVWLKNPSETTLSQYDLTSNIYAYVTQSTHSRSFHITSK